MDRCWMWLVGKSTISSLREDRRGYVTVCLRRIGHKIDVRHWATIVRDLLCLSEEASGD